MRATYDIFSDRAYKFGMGQWRFLTAQLPLKFQKLNCQIYTGCVNISLVKNALEHVHLEDEFAQNQLLIAGRLTRFPSYTYIPVTIAC